MPGASVSRLLYIVVGFMVLIIALKRVICLLAHGDFETRRNAISWNSWVVWQITRRVIASRS